MLFRVIKQTSKVKNSITDQWSSGYRRNLIFIRLWVRIPAPDTSWTFFTLICRIKLYCVFKKTKIDENEARVWPIKKYIEQTSLATF